MKYVIAAVLVWGYAERLLIVAVPLALLIWVVYRSGYEEGDE